MTRTDLMKEVREYLKDEIRFTTFEAFIDGGWEDENGNEISFTDEEIAEIEEIFIDEEIAELEAQDEYDRLAREWEIENRQQNSEYWEMVA